MNLNNYVKIENNIFGYIFKGIKILEIQEKIIIKSSLNKNIINKDDILNENENIIISISLENQDIIEQYIIKFALVLSDPPYNKINKYINNINNNFSDGNEEQYYSQQDYIGRHSYYKIVKNNLLSTICKSEECSLCYENNRNKCITCNQEYSILEGYKECKNNINPKTDTRECSNEEILNNKCNGKLTNSQIKEVYTLIKNDYLYKNYTNENILIFSNNAIFQLSSIEYQQNLDNPLVSNIDFGECENLLKEQEKLKPEEELIILKTDIKSDNYEFTYVQYEIYNPYTLVKLDLNACKNISISINTPIIISSNFEYLFESSRKSGYNLMNSNDYFYNDICSPYTTENGTDIPMEERQNKIFNDINKKSLCQNNCQFVFYNITSKKSKCECDIQNEAIKTDVNVNEMILNNKIILSFFKTLKHSNFIILKCFKLVFSLNG